MGDVQRLVSAVIAHALRQHEDSEWAIVVDGMRRSDIDNVIRAAGARTTKQAIRAIRAHLDTILVPA